MKLLATWLILSAIAAAECIPFFEAGHKIGAITCVRGKVVKITQGAAGSQYLDFCDAHDKCGFSGMVSADDLRDVGDIRTLPGKTIEIHGTIRERDGRAQIEVSEARQLRGAGVKLPPVPKAYDVEQRGHYSAGKFKAVKRPSSPKKKRHPPLPAGGIEVPPDDEE